MPFLGRAIGRQRRAAAARALREQLQHFREVLRNNNRVLELLADAEDKLGGEFIFGRKYLRDLAAELAHCTRDAVYGLNALTGSRFPSLIQTTETLEAEIEALLDERPVVVDTALVLPLADVTCESLDLAGEKMARLGELRNAMQCRVPAGFVVTAAACQRLFEALADTTSFRHWHDLRPDCDDETLAEAGTRLQECLQAAHVPEDLAKSLRHAVAELSVDQPTALFAVRSSALGEDSTRSFAGQYRSLLGVPANEILCAYTDVLASLYAPGVMQYRRNSGLSPAQGLMAVGCLQMVDARAAGVLYTVDPARPEQDTMLVTAAFGLGKLVVDGEAATDRFVVSRRPPHQVLARSLGRKESRYVLRQTGGIERVPVENARAGLPSVPDAKLAELAALAMEVESHMRCAQDLEWAIDSHGTLFVLQARPLRLGKHAIGRRHLQNSLERYPVLFRDRGEVACRGIGHGLVHRVDHGAAATDFPDGAVLVARHATPALAALLPRAGALLTDTGTTTGHLATIARELTIPAVMGTEVATQLLVEGQHITVDAEERVVYEGLVDELVRYSLLSRATNLEAPEFRLLRKLLNKTAPLNLTDPEAPNFTAEQCVTYHDVIRFAHEQAVAELIRQIPDRATGRGVGARRLDLDLPLDLLILDLDGGVDEGVAGATVQPAQVVSAPFCALLRGLTTEGVWSRGPADMDLNGFMASATRSGALTGPLAAKPQSNLALIASDYLHLSLKLGYHFNTVDSHLSDDLNSNFLHFRFAGGVTEMTRRARRAEILRRILEQYDFLVDHKQDLVIASVKCLPREAMEDCLEMVGRLIGFTRQLDIYLRDDQRVEQCVQDFLQGQYNPASRSTDMATPAEILVLDDESIVCDRVGEFLTRQGYRVETETDSQAALARLHEKRFDVVVTDLKMGPPDGLEIMHSLRRQNAGTQVVIITGHGTMEAAREAEFCAVVDFLNKPFELKQLGAVVRKAARKGVRLRGQQT